MITIKQILDNCIRAYQRNRTRYATNEEIDEILLSAEERGIFDSNIKKMREFLEKDPLFFACYLMTRPGSLSEDDPDVEDIVEEILHIIL